MMLDAMREAEARKRVLETNGASASTIEQVLAYTEKPCASTEKPFGGGARPSFPLRDEPHLEVWTRYTDEARANGTLEALARHFVQLRFPIREGISHEAAYIEATRRGRSSAAE